MHYLVKPVIKTVLYGGTFIVMIANSYGNAKQKFHEETRLKAEQNFNKIIANRTINKGK